jgi:3-oxoacyl-[acyl-carrier protein] reductase
MNVVVTGCSKGIGFELAQLFCEAGHNVFALARSGEKLEFLQQKTEHMKGRLFFTAFDLVQQNIKNDLVPQILRAFRTVDILINNAGLLINKDFEKITGQDVDSVLATNFKAPLQLTQALLPFLSAKAHIVNIGSMGGFQGSAKFAGLSVYSASKAALAALTECLSEEFKNKGFCFNCLALGAAQTEMLREAFPGYDAPLSAREMAGFIFDFAINGNKYFNGKILPVSVTTP